MSKTLRIVAKDARHLWPEILLYLGIVIAFAAVEPWGWPSYFHQVFPRAQDLRALLEVLLPLTWWLLIARSVQDESLVGDRQFWTTRPYGWQRILAAKILFLAVFVALPFLLAKAWLLHYAGLSPFANVSVLLLNMLATIVAIFLPLFAIAVVTANLIRMFFVVIAGCLFVGLVAYLNSLVPMPQTYGPDTTPFWILPVCVCVCVAVILMQYARRRTMVARTTLIVLGGALALFTSIREHTWNPHRMYQEQAAAEPPPLTLKLNPDRSLLGPPPGTNPEDEENAKSGSDTPGGLETSSKPYNGQLSIPLLLGGISTNHAVHIDNVTISYKNPISGETEEIRQTAGGVYLPGESTEAIHLVIGPENYRQLSNQPVVLNLTLAVTELEAIGSGRSITSASDFSLPNQGICHPRTVIEGNGERALSDCQFPVDRLPRTLVTAFWSDQPCGQPSSSGANGSGWIGFEDNFGWSLDFDPVQNTGIYLSEAARPHGKGTVPRFLCPGTPVTFTNFHVMRRRLLHLSLPPILPRDYTKGQQGGLGRSYNDF